jgi:IclR family pca regulon transcriptional regulator
MGRVLLAALPSERALELLSAGQLAQRTPKTQTDVAELQRILQDVKAAGYAFIDQEVEIGLRSIAVPLVGARGQTLAALNVGLAATEEPMHTMVSRYLPALLRIKAELSGILV